jgi:phosphoserine phosphatase RsbU/P
MPDSQTITPEQVLLVREVSRMLARTTDLDALLLQIARATRQMLNCQRSSIFLHDARAHQFWTKIALDSAEIRVPEKTGIVGAAFWSNQVVDVPDPYSDPRFNSDNDRRSGFTTRNILAAPVADTDGKPLGVIQAINKATGPFLADDLALIELLADQAGVAIQRHRFMEASIHAAAIQKEMDIARKIQDAMIPKNAPQVRGLESAGRTLAASVTGGDVFDLWATRDGRLGIFLGDASGHGIGPTLVVSQVRTLVRCLAEIDPDPFRILQRTNARMTGDLEAGRFITTFVGFMSPDGQLDYCSAGHGPLLVRDGAGESLRLVEPTLPPVGVLDDLPEDRADPLSLKPGGSFIVLSDGIFEARNRSGEMFAIERVCEKLDACRQLSADGAIADLFETARLWQGQDEPMDDQTVVIAGPRAG